MNVQFMRAFGHIFEEFFIFSFWIGLWSTVDQLNWFKTPQFAGISTSFGLVGLFIIKAFSPRIKLRQDENNKYVLEGFFTRR